MNVASTLGTGAGEGLSRLVEAATALAKLNNGAVNSEGVKAVLQLTSETDSPSPQLQSEACSKRASDRLESHNKKEFFPQRLMTTLQDESLRDVVTWLPHGRSFVILQPDVFAEKVMPKYFPSTDSRASTKYPSFTRKLNRWGFRQATRGPDTGSFHHPLFRRDMPHLCVDMVCKRSKDSVKGGKRNPPPNVQAKKENTIATLTKETLEAMASTTAEAPTKPATVSVTDDCRSLESTPSAADPSPAVTTRFQGPASMDASLVASILKRRDEQERLKIAKAMLYEAYQKAVQGQQ